jgi:hypothetical protein
MQGITAEFIVTTHENCQIVYFMAMLSGNQSVGLCHLWSAVFVCAK